MYTTKETSDYYPLSVLFHDSGLEVEIGETVPDGTLMMWRCEDDNGHLAAAAVLAERDGVYVLADIAVDADLRGQGIGEGLLGIVEHCAAAMGADELWLVGKVPEFYLKYAWTKVERASAPNISKCLTCGQFGKSCFPSIMKKKLSV